MIPTAVTRAAPIIFSAAAAIVLILLLAAGIALEAAGRCMGD